MILPRKMLKETIMAHVCPLSTCFMAKSDHYIPSEYRSAIFYTSPEQEKVAKEVTAQVQKDHFDSKGKKIVTQIVPATKWFEAEDYHQEYLIKNPSGYQ